MLMQKVVPKTLVVSFYRQLVKWVVGVLSMLGLEIMYKEQYMIAGEDYVLDISETVNNLDWNPKYNDSQMIIQACKQWCEMK